MVMSCRTGLLDTTSYFPLAIATRFWSSCEGRRNVRSGSRLLWLRLEPRLTPLPHVARVGLQLRLHGLQRRVGPPTSRCSRTSTARRTCSQQKSVVFTHCDAEFTNPRKRKFRKFRRARMLWLPVMQMRFETASFSQCQVIQPCTCCCCKVRRVCAPCEGDFLHDDQHDKQTA